MNEKPLTFKVEARSGGARAGVVKTQHSEIQTPVFMPVGTQGTVKATLASQVEALDAKIILGNSYHLYLRPGLEVIADHGGLHKMMGWKRSILTDSGGFQVFSLKKLRKLTDEGVAFQSHIDGSSHFFTPEKVMEIQGVIGSDIAMCLDDCPALPATPERLDAAMDRTTKWAARALAVERPSHQALFAIVQGGLDLDRRLRHLEALTAMDFNGFALGGLSVGEPPPEMYKICHAVVPQMPEDKPRYLMGVGTPIDLVEGVASGLDMFDCVLPTRNARMGTVYTRTGRLNIKRAEFKRDMRPIDETCDCPACSTVTRSYLRHLFVAKEITGHILMTLHNIHYYLRLMREIRAAILNDTFEEYRREMHANWTL